MLPPEDTFLLLFGNRHRVQATSVRVFTINAGSSSLKLSILGESNESLAAKTLTRQVGESVANGISQFLDSAPDFGAIGHRVAHGGPDFRESMLLDEQGEVALEKLSDLAPLHNPPAIEAARFMRHLKPELVQVACFDTAFHADLPSEAATYPVPHEWSSRWHLRKYGFHGLSHAYASKRAAELIGRPVGDLRLVTAHLGAGASLAAVAKGKSMDTTMGFTPLAGLMMATRSGDVDPGLVMWLLNNSGLTAPEVAHALEHRSGLLGISGVSGDLREVLKAADAGDPRAVLAYGVYLHRLRAGIASMAAAMGGLDGVVFTGGVGQNSSRLRRDCCAGLEFLGVRIDSTGNEHEHDDRLISPEGSTPEVLVVAAREDLEIAREVRRLLGSTDKSESKDEKP